MSRPRICPCGSGLWPDAHKDGHGIFLFYACEKCFAGKIKQYRPDILERYETDEQIESDY